MGSQNISIILVPASIFINIFAWNRKVRTKSRASCELETNVSATRIKKFDWHFIRASDFFRLSRSCMFAFLDVFFIRKAHLPRSLFFAGMSSSRINYARTYQNSNCMCKCMCVYFLACVYIPIPMEFLIFIFCFSASFSPLQQMLSLYGLFIADNFQRKQNPAWQSTLNFWCIGKRAPT